MNYKEAESVRKLLLYMIDNGLKIDHKEMFDNIYKLIQGHCLEIIKLYDQKNSDPSVIDLVGRIKETMWEGRMEGKMWLRNLQDLLEESLDES